MRNQRTILKKLKESNEKLISITKDVRNTKQEIKNIIYVQSKLISLAIKEYDKMIKEINLEEQTKKRKTKPCTSDTTSIGTQTVGSDSEDELEFLQEEIENHKGYEGLYNLIEKEWPEQLFRTVTKLEGNPFKAKLKNNMPIVLWTLKKRLRREL